MYVLVEDGIVKSVQLDKELIPIAIEAPDDILFGDLYDGETFTKLPRELAEEVIINQPLTADQLFEYLNFVGVIPKEAGYEPRQE